MNRIRRLTLWRILHAGMFSQKRLDNDIRLMFLLQPFLPLVHPRPLFERIALFFS